MEILFWLFLFLIVYCYFGYPLLLIFLARSFEKPVHKSAFAPSVSIIVSAWNEEDVIEAKIKNLLSLDYPDFEILIGSDGSNDRTNTIVKNISDHRIRFFDYQQRRGKMAVLNDLVAQARHEFILFTDARQSLSADALKQLMANFHDSKVGCVSGELMLSQKCEGTAQGINAYWNYEKFLRKQESRLHSMLGATGAVYAIRKSLYVPIPTHLVLDDMFVPLHIIGKGYRAIFDETAHAFDEVAHNPKEEYRRKARTLYGNFQIFKAFIRMFNPFISPIAFQFFSHKFLRVMVPILMIMVFMVNIILVGQFPYNYLFAAQIIFYLMALIGGLARGQKHGIFKPVLGVCFIPYVFCLLNFSALVGLFRFIINKQEVTWRKARSS